jgi:hypothetical protein
MRLGTGGKEATRDTTRPGNTSEHKYIHESPMSHRYPSINTLITMDFVFCFRDHVLSHTVYKLGGVTETSHCCLSSYHNLQSIPASQRLSTMQIFQIVLSCQCARCIRSSTSSLPLLRHRLCRRPSRLRHRLCICAARLHIVIHCLRLIQCQTLHATPLNPTRVLH